MALCCVVGGAGFIGQELVRQLRFSGREVKVIDKARKTLLGFDPSVEYLTGDFGQREFMLQNLRGADELVDLAYASIPKTSYEDPVGDIIENLPPAVQLFQIASELGIKKMIFISSGGTVYGQAIYLPIDESHPTNPITPYGITKLAVEKYASLYHHIKKLPVICLRPGNAYGPGQIPYRGQGFIATAIASIRDNKEIILYGQNGTVRDYVHVEDLAKSIVHALELGRDGEIYNVGSGIGLSNRSVLNWLEKKAEETDRKILLKILPPRMFDVRENILSSNKIFQDTGWKPLISFEEGINQVWQNAFHLKSDK